MWNKTIEQIITITVVVLIIITGVLILIPTKKIEFKEKVPLDYDYIWNVTDNLSNVIYDAYPNGEIPKGRAWGTEGEQYAANNILIPNMSSKEICNLEDVDKILIGYVDKAKYCWKQYSSKVETVDFQLVVNTPSGVDNDSIDDNAPIPVPLLKMSSTEYVFPVSECFPVPTGLKHYQYNTMNCNYSFDNVRLSEMNILKKWPFGGTLTGYYYNISTKLTETNPIVGQPIFISDISKIPEDQEGKIFIMEDKPGIKNIINKTTNVSSIIIISDDLKLEYTSFEKYNFSVTSVAPSENNLSKIINLLKNDTFMIVDNMEKNEKLTFTFNFNESKGVSNFDFVKIARIPLPHTMKVWDAWGNISMRAMFWYAWNKIPLLPNCEAIIICDFHNDTHFMGPTARNWNWFSPGFINGPALPFFSINNSTGSWLINNSNKITVSGYLKQVFKKQTRDSPGVESYNVVGYRNISNNADDSIIVISNRYDGWWGQTPGDSGAGAGIVLGIAKYIADNDMPLKHNLLFLFTTGEEYGKRGAWHYVDTHQDENYNFVLWIGLDQLAFNQTNTDLAPQFFNKTKRNIVWELANETGYESRTRYKFNPQMMNKEEGSGAEDDVWINVCDTICFVKDSQSNWTRYHRAGMNYIEGDTMKYIDQNDLNVTSDLVLETVKYFALEEESEKIEKIEEINIAIITLMAVVIIGLIALLIYQKMRV